MAELTGNYCWVKVINTPIALTEAVLQPMNSNRPPLMKGWQLDNDFGGVEDGQQELRFRPVEGDREAAIRWLMSSDGLTWLGTPLNYFLACYATE